MFSQMASPLEELSLDGFQVVKSEMFNQTSRRSEPCCSLWPHKVSFNKMSVQALNGCEYVRLEVNPSTKGMLIVPVTSKDKDSIRWIKGKKDFYVKGLESKYFCEELYRAWELDVDFNYRTSGRLVSSKGKVMLLFDFSQAGKWKTKEGSTNDK